MVVYWLQYYRSDKTTVSRNITAYGLANFHHYFEGPFFYQQDGGSKFP